MSFADDDLFQEPEEAPDRSSRRSGGGGGSGRGGSGRGPRPPRNAGAGGSPLQQPRIRALIALGLLVVVALILISTVRGCQRNKLVDSYKAYLTDANAIATESQTLGTTLQTLLDNKKFLKRQTIVAQVADLSTKAAGLVERAKKLNSPDRLSGPNRTLISALEYRAQGLSQLPQALDKAAVATATDAKEAAATVAAPMQVLAASDVIYRTSYKVPTENAIVADKIKEVTVAKSEYFPGAIWDRTSLAGASKVILNIRQTKPTTDQTGAVVPGSVHGLSIESVTAVRGTKRTQLAAGTVTPLAPSADLVIEVVVKNGGDFTEAGVDVTLTYKSPTDPTGTPTKQTIEEIVPGSQTLKFELPDQYVAGQSTIVVDVTPVDGEKITSNNKLEYPVEFSVT
jgi:hypothetical protein